jgi:fluoroquinolone resistance protein
MDRPVSSFVEKYYENSVFTGLLFPDAGFDDIEFFRCTLDGCQFLRTAFCRCRFEACVFQKCDLSLLKVTDSRFVDARFVKSKMLGIDWTQAAKPIAIGFQGCNVSHSVFVELSL